MSHLASEISSQPDCWRRAAELALDTAVTSALPERGARVAIVGCGTSLFMAQSFAVLRESAGLGESDAFPASEFPTSRRYDAVVALTRSGTTTEVVRLLRGSPSGTRTTVVTTAPDLPAAQEADAVVVLDFADEKSVVQTRFATTALALWRAWCGDTGGVEDAAGAAQAVIGAPVDEDVAARRHFAFLGTGWTVGLAAEAALKCREAAQAWTESYPAMEFRHGPISVVDERSAVCFLGPPPPGLLDDLAGTGCAVVADDLDPMAQLVRAQLLAGELATRRGLDPDAPRNLTRSIVLTDGR
jgi:fructoselysine-6-P-deglycase FrlB-like protein